MKKGDYYWQKKKNYFKLIPAFPNEVIFTVRPSSCEDTDLIDRRELLFVVCSMSADVDGIIWFCITVSIDGEGVTELFDVDSSAAGTGGAW